MVTAKLDAKASYSCTASESNDINVPVGSVPVTPLTLQTVLGGIIGMKSASAHSLIDFYGSLEPYDLFAERSGLQAFSTPPTEPREVHGSIVVKSDGGAGIELDIKIFHTTRAFDPRGMQAFIFAEAPKAYKLTCSVF